MFHICKMLFDGIRFLPLILLFYVFGEKRQLLKEREQWYNVIYPMKKRNIVAFIELLRLSEYRSLLYFRLGRWGRLIKWMAKGQYALYFDTKSKNIKQGLVIQHGHSTRINAENIGENCQIWHNVTIGTNKSHMGNLPIIGNNCKICAGAIVIGKIVIGDNVTIGAGSVVVKDVPNGCVVVGNPARIIKNN